MLDDPNFRRSPQCGYYEMEYIFKRSDLILEYPAKRLILNPNQDVELKSVQFSQPFILSEERGGNAQGQGLKLPDQSTNLIDIAEFIGVDVPVKVIEVGQQTEVVGNNDRPITIGEYAKYLQFCTKDHKVLNMISLEVSNSSLNAKIQAPAIVRQIDWIDTVWPLERRAKGDYPRVQKYCLAGMAGSYTDFHIDFGGTSVWYHVLSGKKLFYLIAPTTRSLKAYQEWSSSSNQATTFFPDLLHVPDKCFKYELCPGETLVIPSGWIHAVYTPEKALVFGGNFVHCSSILRQLQVHSIECKTHVGKAYRFPYFLQINWYLLCITLPIICRKLEGQAALKDDDSEEEHEPLCEALMSAHVVKQIPFLLKSCEAWINSIPLPTAKPSYATKQESKMFYSSAKASISTLKEQRGQTDAADLPPPSSWSYLLDVISEWWQVLQRLQEREQLISPPVVGSLRSEDDGGSSTSSSSTPMLSNILRLKETPYSKLDLLDESILGDEGRELDILMVEHLGEEYLKHYRREAITVDHHPSVSESTAVTPGSSELKLSLKLARKYRLEKDSSLALSAAGAMNTAESEPAVVSSAVQHTSSDDAKDSRDPSLKLHLRKATSSNQISLIAPPPTSTSSSSSVQRYGTRAVRLSTTFLKNATDIDIDEVSNSEVIEGQEHMDLVGDASVDVYGDGDVSDEYEDEFEDGEEGQKPKRVKASHEIKTAKPLKLPKPPKAVVQKPNNRTLLMKKLGMKR